MKLIEAGSRILFSRVAQVLANAAVVMLVAKTLGPTGQGHYSLTVAVAMLLASLLAGGMGLAAVPVLRRSDLAPGRMLRAQLTWAGGMVLILVALAAWSLTTPVAVFCSDHLGWTRGLGFVVLLTCAGILGFEIFSYDLLARGRLVVGAAVNGVRAAGHLALVLTLLATGSLTFGLAIGALGLAQLCGALMVLAVVVREFRKKPRGPATAAADSANEAEQDLPLQLAGYSLWRLIAFNLRRGWIGQLSAVAYFLLLRLDQGLLEFFRGPAEVGIYSLAVYVGEMLWLLPGALTPLLVHSSSAGAEDPERNRTTIRAVRLGLLLTLAAGIPLYFLAGPLLSLMAGGAYSASGAALRALLPGIVAFAPGAVLAGDFIGRGKPQWNTQASVLTVLINVVAGILLIPTHGAVGAGWASTIAYACGSAVMINRFLRGTATPLKRLIFGK